MEANRRLRMLERLSAPDGQLGIDRLCQACADVVGVDGAGIMLMAGDAIAGSVSTTDPIAERIEDLQYDLGEGPCLDAYRQDRTVFEADLAQSVAGRWPAFVPEALAAGVRAIFAFPLRVGAVRLGSVNLYRLRPGPLTDDQHADAMVIADLITQGLLVMQDRAPPGLVSTDLEASTNFRAVVAQATGMVAVQLDVSVTEALVRLRGHAFGDGRRVEEVAVDVVDRRLRFDDRPATFGGTS